MYKKMYLGWVLRVITLAETGGFSAWDCFSAACLSVNTYIWHHDERWEMCAKCCCTAQNTELLFELGRSSSQHWADWNLPCQRLLVTRAGALHFLLFTTPQAQSVLVYSSSQAWCHASGMGQWRRSKRQRGRFSSHGHPGVYLAYLSLKRVMTSAGLWRLRQLHFGVSLPLSQGLCNSALPLFGN